MTAMKKRHPFPTTIKKIKKNPRPLLIGLAAVVGILAVYFLWPTRNMTKSGAPNFSALVPAGKDLTWQQSKPQGGSNNDAVYIYTDEIDGVPIKVSQQPLPLSFRDNPDGRVAEVAQSFNATDSMQVDGMFVYIGTSAKGPQSVIFSNGSLLILIKSDGVIATGSWADYIAALETT